MNNDCSQNRPVVFNTNLTECFVRVLTKVFVLTEVYNDTKVSMLTNMTKCLANMAAKWHVCCD